MADINILTDAVYAYAAEMSDAEFASFTAAVREPGSGTVPAANDSMLTPRQLSDRWPGVALYTLAQWRRRHVGPSFLKLGGSIRYRLSDVLEYERQNTFSHTAESTRRD